MPSLQLHEPLSFECTCKNKDFCFPDSASYLKRNSRKSSFSAHEPWCLSGCAFRLLFIGLIFVGVVGDSWRLRIRKLTQVSDTSGALNLKAEINWCDLIVVYPAWKIWTVFKQNVALHR